MHNLKETKCWTCNFFFYFIAAAEDESVAQEETVEGAEGSGASEDEQPLKAPVN